MQQSARLNPWAIAVVIWVGTIFFSSTSMAAEWCEQAFNYVVRLIFGNWPSDQPSYGLFHFIADKGFHVALFLILAVLLWKAIPAGRWKIATIVLFGAFIGSCSEFLQRFFPGRDPAVRDVLINVGGTVVGVVVSLLVTTHYPGDSSQSSPSSEDDEPVVASGSSNRF
ncbi:MAG: VanZ family protein [Acidobacteriaceae bacterium]|nr:VanZ family protein [Acidobacteriaceae bacterium]MBV9763853.1 VanZ family protein [Acidobacteriaceae bacterium]